MMFFKSAVILGLVASICATPVPSTTGIDVPHYDTLEVRAAIKNTTCPVYGNTFTAETIKRAVVAENNKANPGTYGNKEGNTKLFNGNGPFYKASLDAQVRAVFTRKQDKKDSKKYHYTFTGLIEHDKGQGNGFHKC